MDGTITMRSKNQERGEGRKKTSVSAARTMRKKVAATTGMSGYFSAKEKMQQRQQLETAKSDSLDNHDGYPYIPVPSHTLASSSSCGGELNSVAEESGGMSARGNSTLSGGSDRGVGLTKKIHMVSEGDGSGDNGDTSQEPHTTPPSPTDDANESVAEASQQSSLLRLDNGDVTRRILDDPKLSAGIDGGVEERGREGEKEEEGAPALLPVRTPPLSAVEEKGLPSSTSFEVKGGASSPRRAPGRFAVA
mmetsp:Transcript_52074/g.96877  ORF Transcript_52074/g.96877 Transcript_52074/m.96877 type:complete len:249 (-) Transcript_52074:77-823(-)